MDFAPRQTAYKLRISQLLSGKYTPSTSEKEPHSLTLHNLKVSRVNLIGHVTEKYLKDDHTYASLLLDDGSGKITVKAWKEDVSLLEPVHVGELVLIIGKIREYNANLYLVPEVAAPLPNLLWAKHRTLELKHLYSEPPAFVTLSEPASLKEETAFSLTEEKVTNEGYGLNNRQKIIDLIEKLDTNNGADQQTIINQSYLPKEEALSIIQTLIKEGEIFELHPGKLRTVL